MATRFPKLRIVLGSICLLLLVVDLGLITVITKNRWFLTETWPQYLLGAMDTLTLWTGRAFWTIVILFVIARGILIGRTAPLPSSDKIIETVVGTVRKFLPPELTVTIPGVIALLTTAFVLIRFLPSTFSYIPPASAIVIAHDKDEKEIYAVDEVNGKVVVIERQPEGGGGLKIKAEIDLNRSDARARPQRIAISPDGNIAYVTNPSADEVIIIDRAHNNAVLPQRISVGRLPRSIAFTPDGTKAYVSNEGPIPQGNISVIRVIDAKNNYVHEVNKEPIRGVNCPEGLAVPYNGSRLYVASQCGINEDPVFTIDIVRDQVLRSETIKEMQVGVSVAVSPQHHKLYVARGNFPSHDTTTGRTGSPFSIIDIRTRPPKEVRTYTLDTSVNLVVVTPDEKYVLVGNGQNITVFSTETDTELKTFELNASPLGIAASKDNSIFVLHPNMKIFTFGLSGLVPEND